MASPPPPPPESSSPPPPESPPAPASPPRAIPLPLALALALPAPAPPQSPPPQQTPTTTTPPPPPEPSPVTALPAQPPSRRLPPPCWSPEETVALIDAYRDKWYSLRRGNLKATHWQDVADSVSSRCPAASPPKTAVQCRHKMEKLRKRYRTEIQRARSVPVARFNSSWLHFKLMDSMEKGPAPSAAVPVSAVKPENSDSNDDDDADQRLYEELRYGSISKPLGNPYRNGGGFRIRIPTGVSVAQPGTARPYARPDPQPRYAVPINTGVSFGSTAARVVRECSAAKAGGKREREKDAVAEMVAAIKALGDGFVRVEQTKMEMAREIEAMRMETEMKRTEMILESQHRIVEAFAKAVASDANANAKKKKAKKAPTPPGGLTHSG